jgi:hypothetical protein
MSSIVDSASTTLKTNLYHLMMCDNDQDSLPNEVWKGTPDQIPEPFTVGALAQGGEFGSFYFEEYRGTERNWQRCEDPRLDQHLPE